MDWLSGDFVILPASFRASTIISMFVRYFDLILKACLIKRLILFLWIANLTFFFETTIPSLGSSDWFFFARNKKCLFETLNSQQSKTFLKSAGVSNRLDLLNCWFIKHFRQGFVLERWREEIISVCDLARVAIVIFWACILGIINQTKVVVYLHQKNAFGF